MQIHVDPDPKLCPRHHRGKLRAVRGLNRYNNKKVLKSLSFRVI